MMKKKHPASIRPLRRSPLATAVHIALGTLLVIAPPAPLLAASASAQAQNSPNTRTYAIPAGPLGNALTTLAAQAGVLLSFDPALAAGKTSPTLNGAYPLEDAFALLLKDSELETVRQPSGDFTLRRRTTATPPAPRSEATLGTVVVQASADASAEGLTRSYAGGQVARGGRVGLLGNQDIMDTPFSTTAYTSELIQDQQARSVADVVQNDPSVRVARGYGNFQEMYVMRGFPVASDDTAYNGLYGLLPRQYVAAELLERVEVFRGANTFLSGGVGVASGFGIGGTINALPKRAPADPLTQVTAGIESGGQTYLAADVARRFGPDERGGIRVNAARRNGETSVDGEERELGVFSIGADYRGDTFRLSADLGHQNHRIDDPRPSVTPSGSIPDAPDADDNFAQSWTYSQERQTFGSLRAEVDFNDSVTGWIAGGMRKGTEKNVLANPTASADGSTSANRFDNVREDHVKTAELGLRGKLTTGAVGHTVVVSTAMFDSESRNAWEMSSSFSGDLYDAFDVAMPATLWSGGSMSSPKVTERIRSNSVALADTLVFADDTILLTLGARHQNFVQKGYNYTTGDKESEYDESRVTPMAGIVLKATPQVSFYANYIEGLTKGDTAPNTYDNLPVTNAGKSLAPHVATQKEVGVKYDGGKIGGNLSYFTTDKPVGIVENSTFTEAGEQRNQGIEITAFGEPLRGVRVLGGASFLDARLKKMSDESLEGNRAIGVPKRQFNLGAEWDIPGVSGLALSGRVVHTSSQYANETNTLSVPSWTRLDLGARYVTTVAEQMVTFRARIDNVTDRDYWASVGGYPGYGYLVLGAPRTFTLSATVNF